MRLKLSARARGPQLKRDSFVPTPVTNHRFLQSWWQHGTTARYAP
jgi:hypothetical protein